MCYSTFSSGASNTTMSCLAKERSRPPIIEGGGAYEYDVASASKHRRSKKDDVKVDVHGLHRHSDFAQHAVCFADWHKELVN